MEFLHSSSSTGAAAVGGIGAQTSTSAHGSGATAAASSAAAVAAANSGRQQQLLAVGDDLGTLHIFEVPRNLTRPVHKEYDIMLKFLDREQQVSNNIIYESPLTTVF